MPFYKERAKYGGTGQFLDGKHGFECQTCLLNADGVTADTYGNKVVYPGTIIAKITSSNWSTYQQCSVKQSAPVYGAGSDVAVGILRHIVDLTMGSKVIALVSHGRVREALCTDEGTVGTIQAGTKTALPLIEWV